MDQFYPILSSSVTRLTSATPVKLLLKCTYTDAAGRERTVEKTARLELRGRNEFLFPLVLRDIVRLRQVQDFEVSTACQQVVDALRNLIDNL